MHNVIPTIHPAHHSYVAGATGDITARMLAEELGKILGTKIIPNNKPGASTVLVLKHSQSEEEWYTLFYGVLPHSSMFLFPIRGY